MKHYTKEFFGIEGLTVDVFRKYLIDNYNGQELKISDDVLKDIAIGLSIPFDLAFEPSPTARSVLYGIIYINVCFNAFHKVEGKKTTFLIGTPKGKHTKSENLPFVFTNIPDAIKMLESLTATTHDYEKVSITVE